MDTILNATMKIPSILSSGKDVVTSTTDSNIEEKPSPVLLTRALEVCRTDLAENVIPGDINVLIPDDQVLIVLRGRPVIEVKIPHI